MLRIDRIRAAFGLGRLNRPFLLRSVAVVFLLATAIHFLHFWQMGRHARGQAVRAAEAERQGDRSEVVASLNRYLIFKPNDGDVRARYGLALADLAVTSRQRWQALQVLSQAMAREPGRLDVSLKATELALALGEPGEASRRLAPLLRLYPDRIELLELHAQAQTAAGDARAAAQSLDQVLQQAPDRVSIAAQLAELLHRSLGQPRQADAVLDRLVKNNPRSVAALLARANHRIATTRPDAAKQDLTAAIALAPRDPAVLSAAAEAAAQRADFAAAAEHWLALLKEKPDAIPAYLGLIRADRERGQPWEAVAALRRGLHELPDQPDLVFALADLLLDQQEWKEAEQLRTRLPKEGSKGRSHYLAGRILAARKRWSEARQAFADAARAGDLSPAESARLMLSAAQVCAAQDFRDEQEAAMKQAVKLDPTPSASLELARLLLARRAGTEALDALRPLVKKASAPEAVWPLLARALIEDNLSRPAPQRDWAEAERVLDRASKAPGNAVAAALLRADMHLVRSAPEDARKTLETARKLHSHEALLWNALVNLALWQGDSPAAEKILAEADVQLAGRVEWLLLRAERLASRSNAEAVGDLARLESAAATLSPEARDRLERALAETCDQQGNYAAVERLCGRILQRHPEDLRARQLLLDGKLAIGDDDAAGRLVAELRKQEGEDGTIWRAAAVAWRINQALRGNRSKRRSAAIEAGLAEARRLVQEVRRRRPGWSHAVFLEGKLHDIDDKPKAALESYLRVLQLGDYQPAAVRRALQLLAAEGRYADANQVLEVVGWQRGLDHSLLRAAADIALRAGKPARACELARLVVGGTRSSRDWLWLGRMQDAAGRTTEAADAFAQAVRIRPEADEGWLAWLSHLTRHGQTEEAEARLDEMKKELPADRLPLALAQAHEVMGQFEGAERAYERILSREPRNATVLGRLLRLYVRTNRNAHAERVLHGLFDPSVLTLEEEWPGLRRQLALAITAPEREIPLVEQAMELLAANRAFEGETIADQRVLLLVRGGLPAERSEALRALERLPGGPVVTAAEQLRLAQLYDAAGDWQRAREPLLALLKADAANPAYMAVLIDGLLRHNKKVEAASWLERLRKLEPDSARTRELLARLRKPARR